MKTIDRQQRVLSFQNYQIEKQLQLQLLVFLNLLTILPRFLIKAYSHY
jgi:hypothetical protein